MKHYKSLKELLRAITVFGLVAAFALMPAISLAQTYTTTSASGMATISSQLDMGARGSNVTALQAFLATNSSWYPEGLVTGYFGPLTRAAVIRFQLANGLPGVGRVGPLTMAAINARIGGGVGAGDDMAAPTIYNVMVSTYPGAPATPATVYPQFPTTTTYPAGTTCPITVSGTAMGSTTSSGNIYTTVYGSTATTTCTVSTSGTVSVTNYTSGTAIGSGSAIVSWNTNESATGKVFYSTSLMSQIEASTPRQEPIISGNVATNMSMGASQSVTLSNLSPGTIYYYIVEAIDASGNVSVTPPNTFIAR